MHEHNANNSRPLQLLLPVISLNSTPLDAVRVVKHDNSGKVHSSLINYPLLFLQAIHKHARPDNTLTHIHSETSRSLVFIGRKQEEEGNISRLSILSSTGASQSSLEITNA